MSHIVDTTNCVRLCAERMRYICINSRIMFRGDELNSDDVST